MTRQMKFITLLLIIIQFVACGLIPERPGKWRHPYKSSMIIKNEHEECIKDAWKDHPIKMGYVMTEGHWEDARYPVTNCRYSEYTQQTTCIHTPGTKANIVDGKLVKGDENATARINLYAKCMITKDSAYECIKSNKVVDGTKCGKYSD